MSVESPQVKPRSLLPKEHGAYAEAGFPIATGLVMSRAHPAAILFSAAALAAFLAHEPLLVVLGHRGERVKRDHGARATRRGVALALLGLVCGLVAVGLAPQEASLWLFIPTVLAVMMVPRILGGTMKTLIGELLAGMSLTTMLLPIGLSGGVVPLPVVLTAAGVWAFTFSISTLAVRAIVHPHLRRARGEEEPESTGPGSLRGRLQRNADRTIVIVLSAWALIGVGAILMATDLPPVAVAAAVPGAVAGVVLGVAKVSARNLRQVGWALVGVYLCTFALLLTAAFMAAV